MSPARDSLSVEELAHGLRALTAGGVHAPLVPRTLWLALAQLTPQPAVELIVRRSEREFLLTYRRDEHWDAWHLPGGFLGCGETVEEACRRVARRELGCDVSLCHILSLFTWPDHPYAAALSIICVCDPISPPAEGTFFHLIPEPIIPYHRNFLLSYLNGEINVG